MRFLVFYLLFAGICSAQIFNPGCFSKSLHSQQAAVFDGAGTLFGNPAMLFETAGINTWLNYSHPFQIQEISSSALAVAFNLKNLKLAIGAWQLGHKLYKEQLVAFGISYQFPGFAIGLKPKLRMIDISRYDSYTQILLDIGFSVPLSEQILLAGFLKNAYSSRITLQKEVEPREIFTGVRFSINSQTALYAELYHTERFSPEFKLAFSYKPLPQFRINCGSGFNSPSAFSAGFSIFLSSLRLEYALEQHVVLSSSHIFSLAWEMK